MRAVIDANVIAAALLNPSGPPANVIREALRRTFVFVWSPPLAAECRRIVGYRRIRQRLRVADPATFLAALERVAEVVLAPLPSLDAVKSDPADNVVLATALVGGAGWVITGDRAHLLPLDPFAGVRIVSPAAFLAELRRGAA